MFWLLKKIHNYRVKKSLANAYAVLAKLQKSFFDSYLKQENLIKQYRLLYKQQIRFLNAFQHAHYLIKEDVKDEAELVKIKRLHEVICSLHLLRFRFNEFSSFEICAQEMQSLQHTSTALLFKMSRKMSTKYIIQENDNFLLSIQAFETIYSNTLQVISRDPSIFQFFIQDLYVFEMLIMDNT